MSRTIGNFISKMDERVFPFARPNSYLAQFGLPFIKPQPKTRFNFELNIKTAEFPGKQIGTSEIRYNGALRKFPNSKIFTDLTLTFYMTDDFRERIFFEDWMDIISSPINHTYGFYEDYAQNSTLELSSINMKGKKVYTTQFREIYPINLAPITVDHGENDSVMLMNVTLAYRLWERTFDTINI